MTENKELVIPPLVSRDIRTIYNWAEWIRLWVSAETLEQMIGLLHIGFDVPIRSSYGEKEYTHADRVVFYLSTANGWAEHWLLHRPEDGDTNCLIGRDKHGNDVVKRPSEVRQIVARKAFDVLCQRFFKLQGESADPYRRKSEEEDRWNSLLKEVITSQELYSAVSGFFYLEKEASSDYPCIRNLTLSREPSHGEVLARDFLVSLAGYIWDWKESEIHSYDSEKNKAEKEERNNLTRARVEGAKPWAIDVLVILRELRRLYKYELDDACLGRIREIAMSTRLSRFHNHVMEDRPVATLEEACYCGSQSAMFLRAYESNRREEKRLRAIFEAEVVLREAQRKVQALTSRK